MREVKNKNDIFVGDEYIYAGVNTICSHAKYKAVVVDVTDYQIAMSITLIQQTDTDVPLGQAQPYLWSICKGDLGKLEHLYIDDEGVYL